MSTSRFALALLAAIALAAIGGAVEAAPEAADGAGARAADGPSSIDRRYYAAWGLDPDDAIAHALFGDAMAQAGMAAGARAYYERAVALDPDSDVVHFWMGTLLLNQNDLDEAERHFVIVADSSSDFAARSHTALGQIAGARGRSVDARRHFRKAVELDPEHPDSQVNLGISLLRSGSTAEAETHLEKALRIKPDLLIARLYLGQIYAGAGRDDEARAQFKEMIAIDPGNPYALFNLGQLEARKGDPVTSTRLYRDALQIAQERGDSALAMRIERRLSGL